MYIPNLIYRDNIYIVRCENWKRNHKKCCQIYLILIQCKYKRVA